ncbi:MAG: hypothetical protein IKZ39_05025, partial [Lachnospiraceae bacterium]|nr:hypothetical protein [Lachnospiraceae bacterium]
GTLKVSAKKPSVKENKLAKKAYSFAVNKIIGVSNKKGKLTYEALAGTSDSITVNAKTGKVTLAMGTKKGSYTLKLKVTDPGNSNYKARTKNVNVKIKVVKK